MRSLISISSTNWLGAWIGLEVNIISFIPLITNNKNILSNESALKYFLIQAIASSSFLLFCLLNSLYSPFFSNLNTVFITNILIIIPLLLKLGAAPFQSWFVIVIEGLTWLKCLILITWQKLAPLFILFYIAKSKIVVPFCIISLVVGSIGGLNQTSLKKIIAYSSVNHLGWLLRALIINKLLLLIYFTIYFFLNLFTVSNFISINLTTFNQVFCKNSIHFPIRLLSLSGLPPFLGFLPKWLVLNQLLLRNIFFLRIIMILTALITTFFYIRLIFRSILISNYSIKYTTQILLPLHISNHVFLTITCVGLLIFNLWY